MPAPNDINSQIALKKGWTWDEELHICSADRGYTPSHWRDPEGEPAPRPDFVGTLGGVAGMMQDLGPRWGWGVWYDGQYVCYEKNHQVLDEGRLPRAYFSFGDRPGDCVGEALLSVLKKETAAKEVKGVCNKGEGSVL